MRARVRILIMAVHLVACAHRGSAPPPPLPAPPLPLPPEGISAATPISLETAFQSCRATGDREGPTSDRRTGRAVIAARIDTTGVVLWATPARIEGLPRSVVLCLLDRVRATRFPPRHDAVDVSIPVDFTRPTLSPSSPLQL